MNLQSKLATLAAQAAPSDPIQRVTQGMDEETKSLFFALLQNKNVSIRSIFEALKDEDLKISRDTLTKYRNDYLRSQTKEI